MHFYESSILWSKDGLQVKSYANQHPKGYVIAKPKYIPTDKIKSEELPIRKLLGKEVNRFDYWISDKELNRYVNVFKEAYPDYYYECDLHKTWFFVIPENKIQEAPDCREGVQKILNLDGKELDDYLYRVKEMLLLLETSGVSTKDIGVTNSTLLGTYTYGKSDMDIMIFGKQNYWDIVEYMRGAKHEMLKWRSIDDWKKYYATYNAGLNFDETQFIWQAKRKKLDGFFGGTVFSIFGVTEPGEDYVEWGDEKYTPMGMATVKGKVIDNYHAAVRPGYYELENTKILEGLNVKVDVVATYARDFMLQAFKGETIQARGLLEKVESTNGKRDDYYRLTVGYFDSYLKRKGEEFIKVDRNA